MVLVWRRSTNGGSIGRTFPSALSKEGIFARKKKRKVCAPLFLYLDANPIKGSINRNFPLFGCFHPLFSFPSFILCEFDPRTWKRGKGFMAWFSVIYLSEKVRSWNTSQIRTRGEEKEMIIQVMFVLMSRARREKRVHQFRFTKGKKK